MMTVRRLMLLFVLSCASVAVLLADGAYVDSTVNAAGESAAGDIGDIVSHTVTAGNFLFWCGERNDDSGTNALTFSNADSATELTGDAATALLSTAFRMTCWTVHNSAGGAITGTFDGSENDGDRWNAMSVLEASGISTSSAVEDMDSSINLAVTAPGPYTTDTVTCAGPCLVVAILATNRDATFTGTGNGHEDWTPSGADGFNYVLASRRESSGGNYSLSINLDVNGVGWSVIVALTESGGGGSPSVLPAIINNPIRGGGTLFGWLLSMRTNVVGARVVQTKMLRPVRR